MNTYSRHAIALGLLITGMVSVLAIFGAFERLERNTIDLRFRHARWNAAPLSERIHHVDIDDGAIDSMGRWPWPRSLLADAVDEIRRAGAHTIAMDILLIDPDQQQKAALPFSIFPVSIDHDANLARAIAEARCILPVQLAEGTIFGEVWNTSQGQSQLSQLMDVLTGDIRLAPKDAADRAGLFGEHRARFLQRPMQFKEVAAWQLVRDWSVEGHRADSFSAFLRDRLGAQIDEAGEFPELRLLRQAWDQYESWRVIRGHLLPPVMSWNSPRHRAPLPVLARSATSVGFVNAFEDADGANRQAPLVLPAPGGSAMQFGLAAAAAFAAASANLVDVAGDHVTLGDTRLPLDEGKLWIYWPTTDTDWSGALRRRDDDSPTAGHTSIGAVISIVQQRRVYERQRHRLGDLSEELGGHFGLVFTESTKNRADIASQAQFLLGPIDEKAQTLGTSSAKEIQRLRAVGELDEGDAALALNLLEWRQLARSVEAAAQPLAAAEKELHQRLSGKLVFIGWTSTAALADFVPTPLGPRTPGVVVHAVIADQILSGKYLRIAPKWAVIVLTPLLGLLCTLIAARATPLVSTLTVVIGLLLYIAVGGWLLFGLRDIALPMVAPMISGAGSWIACTAMQAALFQRDRWRITRQFKARVSPELVDFLVDNPEALSMTGELREVTVMFIDIAGFTALSERMDGPATVAILNRCMSALTEAITQHGGYVNKFLGDGLMAFWSAFHLDPQQAAHACAAAIECQNALQRMNESPDFQGSTQLSVRIGIATERVIVGDCGAPPQLNDYTVIGNGVNLASRLETANKHFGTRILIDSRTRAALDSAQVLLRPLGRILVVGHTTPEDVFEICPADTDRGLIELTDKAVEAFKCGDYDASAAAWNRLSSTFGASKLSETYLEAMADAGAVFNGVLRLRDK